MVHAFGWLMAAALATSGCFGAQAKTIPELPPLDMPAPPPRHVEATEPQMPAPVLLPGEPQHTAPSQQRLAPAQRAESPRPADPPKVEAPAPKTADEGPRAAAPPSTLQTTPAQREGEVERLIRTRLTQASNDLSRINYQALNSDARTQYDTAKRFGAQAEEALRAKNLIFANNLADKAAALAARLLSR
ncbi:MAG: hypothetical protein GEU82_03090 [Luteitalea sp.]|nr:hypothetical protein [Luteitalea sp.]